MLILEILALETCIVAGAIRLIYIGIMKEIELTKGYKAIVDDEDFEFLNQFHWTYSLGYALRHGKVCGKYKAIYMHRLVNKTPKGVFTDHINRNKLDNRKINLRTVTKSQNQRNVDTQSNSTSGFKGVSYHKLNKRWQTYIKVNGKQIALGSYGDARQAAQVYNNSALKYHGQYAKLNEVTYTLEEAFQIMGGGLSRKSA